MTRTIANKKKPEDKDAHPTTGDKRLAYESAKRPKNFDSMPGLNTEEDTTAEKEKPQAQEEEEEEEEVDDVEEDPFANMDTEEKEETNKATTAESSAPQEQKKKKSEIEALAELDEDTLANITAIDLGFSSWQIASLDPANSGACRLLSINGHEGSGDSNTTGYYVSSVDPLQISICDEAKRDYENYILDKEEERKKSKTPTQPDVENRYGDCAKAVIGIDKLRYKAEKRLIMAEFDEKTGKACFPLSKKVMIPYENILTKQIECLFEGVYDNCSSIDKEKSKEWVVVTHPPSYTEDRLHALVSCFKKAGFKNVFPISESSASAHYFAKSNSNLVKDGRLMVVIDLGSLTGGCSIFFRRNMVTDHLFVDGSLFAGGRSFDTHLAEEAIKKSCDMTMKQYVKQYGVFSYRKVLEEAEKAKKHFSSQLNRLEKSKTPTSSSSSNNIQTTMLVPKDRVGKSEERVTIKLSEFEKSCQKTLDIIVKMVESSFGEFMKRCDEKQKLAKEEGRELDITFDEKTPVTAILCGGTSINPLVRRKISEKFQPKGWEILNETSQKIVAKGAIHFFMDFVQMMKKRTMSSSQVSSSTDGMDALETYEHIEKIPDGSSFDDAIRIDDDDDDESMKINGYVRNTIETQAKQSSTTKTPAATEKSTKTKEKPKPKDPNTEKKKKKETVATASANGTTTKASASSSSKKQSMGLRERTSVEYSTVLDTKSKKATRPKRDFFCLIPSGEEYPCEERKLTVLKEFDITEDNAENNYIEFEIFEKRSSERTGLGMIQLLLEEKAKAGDVVEVSYTLGTRGSPTFYFTLKNRKKAGSKAFDSETIELKPYSPQNIFEEGGSERRVYTVSENLNPLNPKHDTILIKFQRDKVAGSEEEIKQLTESAKPTRTRTKSAKSKATIADEDEEEEKPKEKKKAAKKKIPSTETSPEEGKKKRGRPSTKSTSSSSEESEENGETQKKKKQKTSK